MSNVSARKINLYGKTISAAILDVVIIVSSFVLFSSRFDLDSFSGLATFLIIGYPFIVSICTGIVAAMIAETKQLSIWRWGAAASALTLLVIIMLVSLPSFLSAMAFILAPLVAISICFNMMYTTETNTQK